MKKKKKKSNNKLKSNYLKKHCIPVVHFNFFSTGNCGFEKMEAEFGHLIFQKLRVRLGRGSSSNYKILINSLNKQLSIQIILVIKP